MDNLTMDDGRAMEKGLSFGIIAVQRKYSDDPNFKENLKMIGITLHRVLQKRFTLRR